MRPAEKKKLMKTKSFQRFEKQSFSKLLIISIISISITLLDQLIKALIIKDILPISYTRNTGAGFGLFQDSAVLLIWVSIIVVGIIFYLYDRIPVKEKLVQLSTGLILGGTIGNLVDRIRLGYVVDFIDLNIWPSFNIADAAITIGAIGLIIYFLRKK